MLKNVKKKNKIDYQINKILYHFERLKYLGGVEEALKALDSAGFLSVKNKASKNPTKSTAPGTDESTSTDEKHSTRHGRERERRRSGGALNLTIERQNRHEAKPRASGE